MVISTVASVALSILAIWVAYDARTQRNIVLGTVCFGIAVFSMHFVAILLTGFEVSDVANAAGHAMANQVPVSYTHPTLPTHEPV